MKGKILDYNFQESRGIISADDGNRYSFENSQWKGTQSPKVNSLPYVVTNKVAGLTLSA